MALWQADIEKQIGEERWTNRYILDSVTLAGAHAVALQIVALERAVHSTAVTFNRVRTSDQVQNTDVYAVDDLGTLGQQVYGGEYMPLHNVAVVDFNTSEGRPSRKYLRLPFYEEHNVNGNVSQALINLLMTSYATPLLNINSFVDVDGQEFFSASVKRRVGMRQLRRGSKRRVQPII